MSEVSKKEQSQKKAEPIHIKIFNFLSSFLLGIICLVLLGLTVWLSTLEMESMGLYATTQKYFSAQSSPIVIPQIDGITIPLPLPGAYWICAVLFVNMVLGGLVKIRKNPKNVGVMMAHFGIIAILAVGAVDHHKSIHSEMSLYEGGMYDFTQKYDKPSIEVSSYNAAGEKQKPFVIKEQYLRDLEGSKTRTFTFKDLPFDLEVSHFLPKSNLYKKGAPRTTDDGPVVQGYFLKVEDPKDEQAGHGCVATIRPKNGDPSYTVNLSQSIGNPQTFAVEGVLYGLEMPNEIWNMPFEIRLTDSIGEYYPGTRRPKHFQSDFDWSSDGTLEKRASISMNKPLRYEGFTIYQAKYAEPINGMKNSGLAIVTNPVDGWPEKCLYLAGLGLIMHFGVMLVLFLKREFEKL